MQALHRIGAFKPCQACSRRLLVERRISSLQASSSGRHSSAGEEYVLGIESSCDDTGVAVLRASDGEILGHSIAHQADIHAAWGGVVPSLAKEAHQGAMDGTVAEVLRQAGLSESQLHAVAVAIGPGLSMCLKVGVLKAIQLATAHNLRFLPVHHMEAHALIARQSMQVPFPFLCMLVSGGHNLLLLAHGLGDYTLLGSTLDDAVGEAFDKAARVLGLELKPNGGAAMEKLALEGNADAFPFTPPLKKYQDCNFSFAGLKTGLRLAAEKHLPEGSSSDSASIRQIKADIAASFQKVAVSHLVERSERAILWARELDPAVKHFVVSGGVASNSHLRSSLMTISTRAGLQLVCPPPALCTDNGIMIAWAGIERMRAGYFDPIPALPSPGEEHLVDVRPRWPLTNRMHPKSRSSPRSQKTSRIFPSLTELTREREALAA